MRSWLKFPHQIVKNLAKGRRIILSKAVRNGRFENAVLFQGVTMDFRQVYKDSEFVKSTIREFNELCSLDLERICRRQMRLRIVKTKYEQPAILAVSIAKFREQEEESTPYILVGHSLGEYAALCANGTLTFEDALSVVQRRGELTAIANEDHPGAMMAVMAKTDLDISTIKSICEANGIDIGNINTPNQVVISGEVQSVERACKILKNEGLRIYPLNTECAFHSRVLEKAKFEFRDFLDTMTFSPSNPTMPIMMNRTCNIEDDPETIKDCLAHQLTDKVDFTTVARRLRHLGVKELHEIGDKKILTGFIDKTLGKK